MREHALPDKEIDLSLRLWSDLVPLASIAERLRLPVEHQHTLGEVIPQHRGAARRVARKHYVSLSRREAHTDKEVAQWGRETLAQLKDYQALSELLLQGRVEATLWIAIFGRHPVETPAFSSDLVNLAEGLNVSILIENYTREGGEVPEKVWLCKAHAARHLAE